MLDFCMSQSINTLSINTHSIATFILGRVVVPLIVTAENPFQKKKIAQSILCKLTYIVFQYFVIDNVATNKS